MLDYIDCVGTDLLGVTVLIGVGLGSGETITVCGNQRNKRGCDSSKIPRRGSQTDICTVGQRWLMLELV